MRDSGKKQGGKKGKGAGSARPFEAFRTDKPKSAAKRERPSEDRSQTRKSYVGKGKKRPVQDTDSSPLPRLNQYIAKAGVCSSNAMISGLCSNNVFSALLFCSRTRWEKSGMAPSLRILSRN